MTRAAQLLEERSRLLLDLTHDAVFVRDMDGRITYWNRGAEDLFGWTADEALGQVAHELLQTVWPEPFADIAARLLRTGRWQGELVHTGRDGTHITVATRWALQRDTSGNPVAHLVTANDATERKQASEDITEAKRAQAGLEFFKHVIDQTHDPIFWQSPADGFRFVYVNEAACRHFGRPAEALLRMSVPDIDPNYPLEEMQKHWQELKRRKAITIETVHRRPSGEIVPVEVTTNYIAFEGEEYVVGRIRDISERRRAEEALRASEERFRMLVDHATDAFALRDEHGILVDVNRHACESLGYDREELIGMSASEIAPYVDLDAIWKRFDAGEQIVTFESCNRRKDGTLFPVEVRARRFMSPEGRPLSLTLARDISERKRAEEALRESEERYRALIEVSPQMVWTTPADGTTIYVNQWWYDYTGLTRPETEGFLPIHPDHRRRMWKSWRQTVASGAEWSEEAPLRRVRTGSTAGTCFVADRSATPTGGSFAGWASRSTFTTGARRRRPCAAARRGCPKRSGSVIRAAGSWTWRPAS
jgi:two-component system, cell cycle sensor histidine kinase and response regulator CckA